MWLQDGLLVGQPQQASKGAASSTTAATLLAQDAPASMPQPRLAGSRKRADPEQGAILHTMSMARNPLALEHVPS